MKLLNLAVLVVLVLECASKETKDKKKAKDSKTKLPKIKEKKMFNFVGKDHWSLPALAHCFKEPKLPNDYFCYKYYRNYEVVYIDPVATIPIILVYRNFIPQKFLDDFLRDVKKKQKSNQQKGIDDMGFMRSYLNTFKKRVANSTTIQHTEMSGVARVFRRAQSLIPMLNFSISSPWEVISYKKGGHHSPHYDYITYSSPDQYSKETREYGNRFLTFMVTLKSAKVGGETIFVFLNRTVELSAGDVLVFTNIDKNLNPASGSVHAECPVEKGEKITATLWLRPKGQEFFNSHSQEENMFAFDIEKLIAPNMKSYGISPFYDVYAIRQLMAEEYARMHAEMQRKKS
nr:Oxoglutarate iron-dependent oxygenase domain containing protein [Haemonchus contortus]